MNKTVFRMLLSLFILISYQLSAQDVDDIIDSIDIGEEVDPFAFDKKEDKKEEPTTTTDKDGNTVPEKKEDFVFIPGNPNEGVYPDISVLSDPLNPFRKSDYGSLDRRKWDHVNSDDPEADFYLWATLLSFGGNGENQYYTAVALQNAKLYDHAIRAFQAVLEYFPEDMSVTEEGYEWSLKTAAEEAILNLGGKPSYKIQKRFKFSGGRYLGRFATSSMTSSNYAPWSIGQAHSLEMKIALHPAPQIHGYVSFLIAGSRPTDIPIESYGADHNVTPEVHVGAYVHQVDLKLDTSILEGRIFKGTPVMDWDDILDIHPKVWWLEESYGRGWGYPAGFSITEKVIPFNTRLTFEGGPAPNMQNNMNTYYVRATPQFGPVKADIAWRHTIPSLIHSAEPEVTADWAMGAIYLNNRAALSGDLKYIIPGIGIETEAQVQYTHHDKRMFYHTNADGKAGDIFRYTGQIAEPMFGDFMSYAARFRYNPETARGTGTTLPIYGEMYYILAQKWVPGGNKHEFRTDIYWGPFWKFLVHTDFTLRRNLEEPTYLHPGKVFRDNRAATIIDVALTFDWTPETLMRETWGDKLLTEWEDAPIAAEVGFRLEDYPTWTDPLPREWGFTPYAFAPEPNDTHGIFPSRNGIIYSSIIGNIGPVKITAEGRYGLKQPDRGTVSPRVMNAWTTFQDYSLELNYKNKSILSAQLKLDDWLDYMYDPLPESEFTMRGVVADRNLLITFRQSVMNNYFEIGYENIACEDFWGLKANRKDELVPAWEHFVFAKFDINF